MTRLFYILLFYCCLEIASPQLLSHLLIPLKDYLGDALFHSTNSSSDKMPVKLSPVKQLNIKKEKVLDPDGAPVPNIPTKQSFNKVAQRQRKAKQANNYRSQLHHIPRVSFNELHSVVTKKRVIEESPLLQPSTSLYGMTV
ncbi:hypothetical protein T09_12687 [Trichinella sp. T9]|nr:hypothetical protein T09_12687 [Trichinella sp. T9]